MTPKTKRTELIELLQNPAKRMEYQKRGKASVPGGVNACAAVASQPHCFDLRTIGHIETWAETFSTKLKRTRLYEGSDDREDVLEGDIIVCQDKNKTPGSDHVWHVVRVLGGGEYECFDNQPGAKARRLSPTTYRRRLDGADGTTPMRGRLRLNC